MRQTFFHELQQLEKREKQEKKEKVELYLRNKSVALRDSLPLFSMILIVFFSVLLGMYAIYSFVNLTKIDDLADVHVSRGIRLAIRKFQGTSFSNSEKGIFNWMLYKDVENSFELAYPEEWAVEENEKHVFEIRKYNIQEGRNESLASIIYIDELENAQDLSLLSFVVEETGLSAEKLIKGKTANQKEFIRTGKIQDERNSEPPYSRVFWEKEGRIYCLKIMYYNQNNLEAENDLDKIISEFKIL